MIIYNLYRLNVHVKCLIRYEPHSFDIMQAFESNTVEELNCNKSIYYIEYW